MTRSTKIALTLIIIFSSEIQTQTSGRGEGTLDLYCPCTRRFECADIFGEKGDPLAYTAILKALPSCPSFQVRCCSKDSMFHAIMLILEMDGSRFRTDTGARTFTGARTDTRDKDGRYFKGEFSIPGAELRGGRVGSGSRVECVTALSCPKEDIYGTDPSHFSTFGFISPSKAKCFANSGNVLCVLRGSSGSKPSEPAGSSPVTFRPQLTFAPVTFPTLPPFIRPPTLPSVIRPPTSPPVIRPPTSPPVIRPPTVLPVIRPPTIPPPTKPGLILPCLPISSCTEVYGTQGSHFSEFGSQPACPRSGLVRCVSFRPTQPPTRPTQPPTRPTRPPTRPTQPPTRPTRPTPPATTLLCLPPESCEEIFGTKGYHFLQFGIQSPCSSTSLVRCVRPARPTPTPTPAPCPIQTCPLTPGPIPTPSPGLGPGPSGPSVQIIGPQPIYVTFNNIKGPTVGSGSDTKPGVVESFGVNPSQENQINLLLQSLKTRLQHILGGSSTSRI